MSKDEGTSATFPNENTFQSTNQDGGISPAISALLSEDVSESKLKRVFWDEHGTTNIEKATRFAEVGRFQIFLLIVCLIAFFNVSAFPNVLMKHSYAIECDYQLIKDDKKAINDVIYLCMILGGAAWSLLADTLSRKWTLILVLFVHTISMSGFLLARTFLWLGLFQGICSFCRSGIMCITIAFISEFQISYFRGSMICALQLAWIVGLVVIPAFPFSWKSLIIIGEIPSVVAIFALIFIPDSPRFLLSRGREKEAIRSLQMIHAINTGTTKINFPIAHLVDNKTAEDLRRTSIVKPFIPDYLEPKFISIPIVMLSQFVIMFSYITLSLWFPYLTSRKEALFPIARVESVPQDCKYGLYYMRGDPNDFGAYTKVEFLTEDDENSTIRITPTSRFQAQPENPCANDDRNRFDHQRTMLDVLACMASVIFLVVKIDTMGRKFFIILAQVLAGFLAFVSYFMHNAGKDLLFSCLFDSVTLLSIGVSHCLAVELFPTRVRVLGVALVVGSGQLGCILADIGGALCFGLTCVVIVALIAISLATSGMLIMAIPDTTGIPLR